MRCSVQNCSNDTKTTTKSHGITFHLFPKEQNLRTAWVEALGMADWEPKERSTICSAHFKNKDFYETKRGLRKIKNGAVPLIKQDSADNRGAPAPLKDSGDNLDAPAALRVCRICLAMDTRMYHIRKFKLDQMYEQITGLMASSEERLPQRVCWECAARLSEAYRFRSQALRSDAILHELLHPDNYIKISDIRSINGTHNDLKSSQTQKIFDNSDDNSDYDLHLGEETEIIEDNIDIQEDLAYIPKVEVKDESRNEAFEEYDNLDDDEPLSEFYMKKKEKARVKKKKVVKVKRVENSDPDDSDTATDRYKKPVVKRRKMNEPLDKSLYTITSLTYDEQIQEVLQRQKSPSYVDAPYKCTVCYRGFKMKCRLTDHSIRHSEQRGAHECFICKCRVKNSYTLSKHLGAMHTEQYSCKKCPFVTKNRTVAKGHERWHAGTKYQCPHCDREFDKHTTYMGHIRIKHVPDFVCELCGFMFVSKKGIDIHKKIKHRLIDKAMTLKGPYCKVCDVKFVSEDAYDRHLKLSPRHISDHDPNRMRNDPQNVTAKRNGRVARRREHRPAKHPRESVEMNHELHTPVDCEQRPQDSDEMNVEPHTPVNCEQCGLQLRDLYLYALHFKKVHPDKNRTKYPTMKTPCMCEQCGKIFQSIGLLKNHMWIHTGEKCFKCDHCAKSFSQKINLVFHMRVHSATRPTYECPLCGKHFTFFRNRRRHMLIHTGLKPFKCDTCGKCFTTSGEQHSHVEHVHLKKPWPKRVRQRTRTWKSDEPSVED